MCPNKVSFYSSLYEIYWILDPKSNGVTLFALRSHASACNRDCVSPESEGKFSESFDLNLWDIWGRQRDRKLFLWERERERDGSFCCWKWTVETLFHFTFDLQKVKFLLRVYDGFLCKVVQFIQTPKGTFLHLIETSTGMWKHLEGSWTDKETCKKHGANTCNQKNVPINANIK